LETGPDTILGVDETALMREIAVLETELATLQTHEAEGRSTFTTLDEQLAKVSARIAEVRRAAADRDDRLQRARLELAVARGPEADHHEARRELDAAAEELANRIERVLSALAAYDDARKALDAARARLTPAVLARLGQQDVPEDPANHDAVAEQWARLASAVGSGATHENELIEAAVRSPMGHAIANLPVHLRPVARRRREDYLSNLARSLRVDEARARQIES
jgi:DNA repair exonuclease SbcCD ATPase subunit